MSDEKHKNGETRDPGVERAAVAIFGARMLEKLQMNSDKAHWSEVSYAYLMRRLIDEVWELVCAFLLNFIGRGSKADIISECCDVALFAMMIADNIRTGAE